MIVKLLSVFVSLAVVLSVYGDEYTPGPQVSSFLPSNTIFYLTGVVRWILLDGFYNLSGTISNVHLYRRCIQPVSSASPASRRCPRVGSGQLSHFLRRPISNFSSAVELDGQVLQVALRAGLASIPIHITASVYKKRRLAVPRLLPVLRLRLNSCCASRMVSVYLNKAVVFEF